MAHLGVLRVLEEYGIRPAYVAGSSIGGIIAIGIAAGMTSHEMTETVRRVKVPRLLGRDRTGLGLVGTDKIGAFVARVAGKQRLEDLDIPCVVTATDIIAGELVVIDRGPIARAVQATIAMPGIFSPVCSGERVFIDGGILEPVPVAAAWGLGAAAVVGVDVSPRRDRPLIPEPGLQLVPRFMASPMAVLRLLGHQQVVDVLVKTFEVQSAEIARYRMAETPPTVFINPEIGEVRMDQFEHLDACIAAGEAAARAVLPQLLALKQA